jgi:hypothetical protein
MVIGESRHGQSVVNIYRQMNESVHGNNVFDVVGSFEFAEIFFDRDFPNDRCAEIDRVTTVGYRLSRLIRK